MQELFLGTAKMEQINILSMSWNKRLAQAREGLGINKSAFAKAIGVSAPTITDWESGEIKKIDGENLIKACEVLKVSPGWVMTGRGNKTEGMSPTMVDGDQLIELIALFQQASTQGKSHILDSARATADLVNSRWRKVV